jgi:hypothetical protein
MLTAILFSIYIHAFISTPVYHDIHVSVCEIDLKQDEGELLLKTFLDDLQLAIGLVPGEELPDDYTSADVLIDSYIQENIKLTIGGEYIPLVLEDISTSGLEAVWITYRLDKTLQNPPEDFRIENSLLTEVYSDQTNLIKVTYGDGRKTFTMDRKKKSVFQSLK